VRRRAEEERAAASQPLAYAYTSGMARAGVSLVQRQPVRDACFGIDLVSKAASMGSDLASYSLGQWHEEGSHGLPHDLAEAKFWYSTVPACATRHLDASLVRRAAARVGEIDTEAAAWASAEAAANAAIDEALAGI